MNYRLISHYFDDVQFWAVVRIKNPDEPLHAGNIEYAMDYTNDRDKAQKFCDELNGKGE